MSPPSISRSILAILSSFLLVSTALVSAVEPPVQRRGLRSLNLSPDTAANIVSKELLEDSSDVFVENPFQLPSPSQKFVVAGTSSGNRYRAGYAPIPGKAGSSIFFYHVISATNPAKAPLILYLIGGPGFSAGMAMFKENGPFRLTGESSITVNELGLDQTANVVYVDQPIGTGYSFATSKSQIPTTSEEVTNDLFAFLQVFLSHHPELKPNGLYIVGESYAAHYIPSLATRILQTNNLIKLQGVAVASAWANPSLQFASYPEYALKMKLINKVQFNNMTHHVASCSQQAQQACDANKNWAACAQANTDCNDILWDYVLDPLDNINFYDVTKKCGYNQSLCYDFSNVERYMNLASVKSNLGVRKEIKFVAWSSAVFDAMAGDQMRSFQNGFATLLQRGLKVHVYVGVNDLICNPMGNLEWLNGLNWQGGKGFKWGRFSDFQVSGSKVGTTKSSGPLSLVIVDKAGHFIGMDQPKAVLEMMKRWTKGQRL